VQGRSEFGPRALGNRSIIADPRPAAHKDTINAMIKKREAYRPFAPSIIEEEVARFFDIPADHRSYPFMSCVLPVCAEWRETLGAITHVDGTARLQTLRREDNPRYWDLIAAFGRRTGIPILLNTSFNNNAEPIVDSVDDAVTCFLTSGLHRLVVGAFIVSRRRTGDDAVLSLVPSLPPAAVLSRERRHAAPGALVDAHRISWNYKPDLSRTLSPAMFALLSAADGTRSADDLIAALGLADQRPCLAGEMHNLWSDRVVRLLPHGNMHSSQHV
jgi:carbamoyltransferase